MPPLYAAALIVFFEGLVLWAVFPIMNFYCEQFHGGPAAVGLMFGLLSAPKILSNPVFGRLSDRIGRRPLLLVASAGTLAGSVGWALAPNLVVLALSRLVAGVFSAQSTLCQSVVTDTAVRERRAAGMGVLGAAFGASMVLGPLVADQTVALTGSYAAVGWVCAAIQACSVATALLLLPETHQPAPAAAGPPAASAAGPLPDARAVILFLGVSFLLAGTLAQLTSTFGLFLHDNFALGHDRVAYAFTYFGVIGIIVQGGVVRHVAPRCGERMTGITGLLVTGLGFVVLALSRALWLALVGTTLLGIGAALAMPVLTALLSRSVSDDRQGAVLGWQQSMMALGRGVGAVVAGGLYAVRGPGLSYGVATALALGAALALAGAPREPLRGAAAPRARSGALAGLGDPPLDP